MKGRQILTLKPKHLTPDRNFVFFFFALISQDSGNTIGIQLTHPYIQYLLSNYYVPVAKVEAPILWPPDTKN